MKIWIIFKKELKDILRDRRTIMMMIIFPLLIAPAIITGVSKVQMMQMKKAQEKKITKILQILDFGKVLTNTNKIQNNYGCQNGPWTNS